MGGFEQCFKGEKREKYADLPCDFRNDGRSITVSIGTVKLTAPAQFGIDINILGVGRNEGCWDVGDAYVREPTDPAVN